MPSHATHALASRPPPPSRAPAPSPNPPGKAPGPYSYLPFFYSRVFNLSWQFYGSAPAGATIVPFGLAPALAAAAEAKPATFGAYWLAGGRVVGVFVESGSPEENAAAKAIAAAPPAADEAALRAAGAAFLLEAAAARL
jgi:monodehydroascorbate reductase (NADH)